jgi:hypothetical protein
MDDVELEFKECGKMEEKIFGHNRINVCGEGNKAKLQGL